jgi:hypothetical protein
MYTIADLSREYLERLPFQAQHQPAASSSAAAHSRTSAHDDAGQDAANRTSGGAETFGRREFGSEEGGGSGGDGGLGEVERRKVLFNGTTTQDVLGDLFKGVAYLHRHYRHT